MKVKRILMSLIGVILCGIGVGIIKAAFLGVDPYQTLTTGLDFCLSLNFGTIYLIVTGLLFIFMFFADRHYIGFNTFINLFFLGYIAEYTQKFVMEIFVNPSIAVKGGIFAVGFIVLCLSASLYMTADLGVSTYDSVALIIANTWHKGKFKYIRIATDFTCVILGSLIILISGGSLGQLVKIVGVGTVLTAFFMGPVIELFNKFVSRPILGDR